MSLVTEREMIETHFKDLWFDTINGVYRTPVQWEDITVETSDTSPWVAIKILNGQEANRSVGTPGSNIVRAVGVLTIQVHIPSGFGSAQFRTYADDIMAQFRNTVLGNIRFMPPYVSGGSIKVGNFSSWTIMCPFTRDEFNG